MQAGYLVVRFYFSSKYVRWLYVPSEGHVTLHTYFLLKGSRRTSKVAGRALFAIANSYICFEFLNSLWNFNFSQELSCRRWQAQSSVHVTTRLFWPELSHSTRRFSNLKSITSSQVGLFKGKNIEWEQHISWFALHICTCPQNMSDGYMSRQRDI